MRFEHLDRLTGDQIAAILDLVRTVTTTTGNRPLSDRAVLHLEKPHSGTRHLLACSDETLAGYAQLARTDGTDEAEVAVTSVADAAALCGELQAGADRPIGVWARGRRSVLNAVFREAATLPTRVVLQLRRPLSLPLAAPALPAAVTLRTFITGADETAWLAVNNRAFVDHPDQSDWSIEDLVSREREPWFDPAGFFLAERDGQIVGFHWTKIHPADASTDRRIGEIYVLGVDPSMQGQHLGSALALVGLHYLAEQHLPDAMLYVEQSNPVAVRMYEQLGFSEWDVDSRYELRAGS